MSIETTDVHRLRELNQVLEEAVVERTRLLMNAKRAWEATFDAIVDPLAIVDRGFRIVRTNLAHASIAGKDVRTLNGRLCHEVLFGRRTPCEGCTMAETFETGVAAEAEIMDLSRDRVFRMWTFPKSTDPNAGIEHVVCHYKDVTEEKELQRKLLQNEKMAAVGTLAGGVAHEINNPLGAILAFSELARADAPKGTMLSEFLTEIEDSARRCQRIVMSLLDFSRPSRGERRFVDLNAVVEHSIFLVQTQFGKSGATLKTVLPERSVFARGDRHQLTQVMVNLMTNAYQALDGRGEIVTGIVETPDHAAVIYVEDDGPGIPERYIEKVFEPFFTTKPEGQGTGLGLSISYGIVRDHDATIQVISAPPRGARFEVRFPARVLRGEEEAP